MQEHFVKCLENEKMEQFSWSKRSAHTNIRSAHTIPVYCTCKMPESLDNMVECETCFQWFHYRCVGIANERDTALWNCWSAEEDVRDNDLSDETIIICALTLLKQETFIFYCVHMIICALIFLWH